MAVSVGTSFSSEFDVTASPVYVRVVEILLDPDATAQSYVQLFNANAATMGSDTPDVVLPSPDPANVGKRRKMKYVFAGGLYFPSGLTWAVTTTHDGGTGATTHAPLEVRVFYGLGG